VLGVANQRLGGSLLFFRPSIEFLLSTAGKDNPWKLPLAEWLPSASWLIWPACVALGSVVDLAPAPFRPAEPGAPASGWWPVNFLVAAVLFLSETVRGTPLLQLSFYASYLIGPLMLACGTLLAAPLTRLSRPAFGAVSAFVIGCAVLGVKHAPVP